MVDLPLTRWSGGTLILAKGAVVYKPNLLPTMPMLSNKAEFTETAIVGHMVLYCRSVMWDLVVPQYAATIGYTDNDVCTAMSMAQKPTPWTRHIDIKYHVICQWMGHNSVKMERVTSTLNVDDISTKQSGL